MTTLDWHGTGISARGPVAGVAAQLLLLAALGSGAGLRPVGWLAGTAYAVILAAILTGALLRSRARSLGPAGLVTLARAELVGGVTALVAMDLLGAHAPAAFVVALAAVALVLDGVDGHVARRTGTVSALGARFDMEVDAFLILVLSVFVARSAGPWVLAIGLMRYAFVAAGRLAPWLRAPLPPSFARKTVAASQGVILVVVAAGVAAPPVAAGLAGLALGLLAWSFGRDTGWLWRHRRTPARPPIPALT
ncbi:membrane protein [Sphaerisporangium rufum]|uniref:Membrane protein n=1 Tax=Sphaerisporangium rufum TaxID=1381558 RepID=A0A919QYZ7_9ACTN|nr:CDP-alcohol phosphatidyltransferase family protein [Sphaerisporangium rufum]GII76779.1 membrane protein [Sphaerisporangium rufum]